MTDEPLAPGTARPAFGEEDLRLYLGPNADDYMGFRDRLQSGPLLFALSWNWWGLLFPVPWLMYRKLWAVAAAVVLLPTLLDSLVGHGTEAALVLSFVIALSSRPLVIERAERTAREVSGLGLVAQDSIERLRRAGGVSRPGAVIGGLLMAAGLALMLYDNLPLRLPGCGSPVVRDVVIEIALENADSAGLVASRLRLDRIRQIGYGDGGEGRLCHAELRGGSADLPVEYKVQWEAPGRFLVDLRFRDG